jgi:hypothetical protein
MDVAVRIAFLAAAGISRDVLACPAVAAAWEKPSALRKLSVSGLCGHLARGTVMVAAYLQAPEPAGPPLRAAADYFATFPAADIDSEVHTAIRRRGEEAAAAGHAALVVGLDEAREKLSEELPLQPVDRLMRVAGDQVMRLDDYLETRLVELALHTDDLCVSVGLPSPAVPGSDVAIRMLVDVARARHGDLAVLRALGRRERDRHEVLRVL